MTKAKSRKRRKFLILSVIVVGLIAVGTAALLKKKEIVIKVQTEKAARRDLTEIVVANGRIQPVMEVKISPEVSGEIIGLPVKEGQEVHKGGLLLKIKPDIYEASVHTAEASYKATITGKATAEANLRKAELDFKRIEKLYRENTVSDSNYLDAKTSYEVAQAQVQNALHQIEMAEARLASAREDLAKTSIFSPINGAVSRLNSELGERVVGTATMAGTEVMTVADLNQMEALVDIGEMDVVLIKIGQKARLEVDAFRDRKFTGCVTEIANAAKYQGQGSQDAVKFQVAIRIDGTERFRPGMSVTADVETQYRTNVVTVPIQSVTTRALKPKRPEDSESGQNPPDVQDVEDNGESKPEMHEVDEPANRESDSTEEKMEGDEEKKEEKEEDASKPVEVVFVVDKDRVTAIPVKLGISDDDYYEITEGIEEGMEIVSGGYKAISRDLEDGSRIVKESKPNKSGEKPKD